jgi:hypothetical protein
MSRYDILLNDPKKQVTPREHPPASPIPTARPPDEPAKRSGDEPTERPDNRAAGKGVLVRRGFEWREDQLRTLKNLSLQEQLEGKQGNMSAMVREALDDYFKKRAAKQPSS